MIQQDVTGLNEANGSTHEPISGFIKKKFQDLPWAHSSILGVNLNKLCEDGEIFRNDSGIDVIVDDCGDNEPCEINEKVSKGINKQIGSDKRVSKRVKGDEPRWKYGLDVCTGLMYELR